MTGTLPELARQKVLGEAGSQVVLTILREGVEEPFDVPVTRQQINIPSTEYRMLDDGIAYVRLNAFSNTTGDELHKALQELLAENPKGLIRICDITRADTSMLPSRSVCIYDGVVAYDMQMVPGTHLIPAEKG
jgi:carboxyl-terminal processing protease